MSLLRCSIAVLVLAVMASAALPLRAEEGAGQRELALGREAAARQDHEAARKHFDAALLAIDPTEDPEVAAEVWLQIGLTSLNGLENPEAALTAFLASATLAPEPATAWLWASVTAEKLGREDDAARYKTRALRQPVPAPAPSPAPAPVVPPAEPAPARMAPMAPTASVPEPAPVPQPVAEAPSEKTPAEKPDAVQHFFGAEAQKPKEPVRKKDLKNDEGENPARTEEKKETVDAVQYFFGEKQEGEAGTGQETPTEEKPPSQTTR